jgi:hypothetical protein
MEDIFFNLKLDHDLIHFPTLSEEEKGIIETILQGRSTLGPDGWDMIKTIVIKPGPARRVDPGPGG